MAPFSSSIGTGSYTSSLEVGDVIKYSNNSESMISNVIDSFHAETSSSYNIDPGQSFIIWKTSQQNLEKEVKRHSSYLTSTGGCFTTDTGSIRLMRRTYDFSAETSQITYTELGTSWSSTYGNGKNIFSRMLLPTPITIDPSYKLRLIYQLQVTFTPESAYYFTASVSGWPVAPATSLIATQSIQKFLATSVNTIGATEGFSCLDPASSWDGTNLLCSTFVSPVSSSLANFNSAIDRSSGYSYVQTQANLTIPTYVTRSFTQYKNTYFTETQGNMTNLRSIGFGNYAASNNFFPAQPSYQAFCVLFNESQSKFDTQQLHISWVWRWTRTLS
jgi:hypothetical protein